MARRATLEILQDGDTVLGSPTGGRYWVKEFENDVPRGGSFFKRIEEAERYMVEYENSGSATRPQFLSETPAMLNDPFDDIRYPEDEEPNPYSGTYSED